MKISKQKNKQLKNKERVISQIIRYFLWTLFGLFILLIVLSAIILPSLNLKH